MKNILLSLLLIFTFTSAIADDPVVPPDVDELIQMYINNSPANEVPDLVAAKTYSSSYYNGIYQLNAIIDSNLNEQFNGFVTINENVHGNIILNWLVGSKFNVLTNSSLLISNYDSYNNLVYRSVLRDINYGTYTFSGIFSYYPDTNLMFIIVTGCYGNYCPVYNLYVGTQIW